MAILEKNGEIDISDRTCSGKPATSAKLADALITARCITFVKLFKNLQVIYNGSGSLIQFLGYCLCKVYFQNTDELHEVVLNWHPHTLVCWVMKRIQR